MPPLQQQHSAAQKPRNDDESQLMSLSKYHDVTCRHRAKCFVTLGRGINLAIQLLAI